MQEDKICLKHKRKTNAQKDVFMKDPDRVIPHRVNNNYINNFKV